MEPSIEQRPPEIPQKDLPVVPLVETPGPRKRRRIRFRPWLTSPRLGNYWIAITIGSLIIGSLSGYQIGLNQGMHAAKSASTSSTGSPAVPSGNDLMTQVNPPDGYKILARLGQIGPKILAAGAIDLNKLLQVYAQSGKTLPKDLSDLLTKRTDADLMINAQNAGFFLNFFWALGLVNQNPILTEGKMMADGKANVGNFASTGGWTIGARDSTVLFASTTLVPLTSEQQDRVKEVANAVFRPCCDNPTSFPDCNHGMAMLGLIELMASQNASVNQMFEAAKYANAYWFPQQNLELAISFKASQNADFGRIDARQLVSNRYSSGSGFQFVHQWLVNNNLLEQAPNSNGSCAVQ
jgi:hypothetical protein